MARIRKIWPPRFMRAVLTAFAAILLTAAARAADDAPYPASMDDAPGQPAPMLLYFADAGGGALRPEPFFLSSPATPHAAGRALVEALTEGPKSSALSATLPAGIAVRGFFIAPGKTAVVDLDGAARDRHPGGIMAETLAVFSIVNTLALNFSEIEQVTVLFDGQESQTFAGHIDLQSPLKANILLIK